MTDQDPKYRGGCTPGMRVGTDDRPGCRATCGHRAIVQGYRDQRDAWEALRESSHIVTGIAGTDHANVSAYQLTDAEFAQAHPPPTFKAWLEGIKGQNQEDWTPCTRPA